MGDEMFPVRGVAFPAHVKKSQKLIASGDGLRSNNSQTYDYSHINARWWGWNSQNTYIQH